MIKIDAEQCQVHVNVCTNERPPGTGKPSCKDVGGHEFYLKLKDKVKDTGIRGTHWVTRTGCLGFCNKVGTTVTIHRKGQPALWLSEVTAEDFDRVWDLVTSRT